MKEKGEISKLKGEGLSCNWPGKIPHCVSLRRPCGSICPALGSERRVDREKLGVYKPGPRTDPMIGYWCFQRTIVCSGPDSAEVKVSYSLSPWKQERTTKRLCIMGGRIGISKEGNGKGPTEQSWRSVLARRLKKHGAQRMSAFRGTSLSYLHMCMVRGRAGLQ